MVEGPELENVAVMDAIKAWRAENPTGVINPHITNGVLQDAFGMKADGAEDLAKALMETEYRGGGERRTMRPRWPVRRRSGNRAILRAIAVIKIIWMAC